MCCVCSFLCKIISFIVSLLFIVAVVLLILWGVGVLFGNNNSNSNTNTENQRFLNEVTGAGLKHFAST